MITRKPFPHVEIDNGHYMAKLQHVWNAARRWASANNKEHNYSTVQGVAPL